MKDRIKRKLTKDEALKILAQMNDMVCGRNFANVSVSKEYEGLCEKLRSLGWLALVKKSTFKIKRTENGNEIRLQLKLVSPDSEEARNLP